MATATPSLPASAPAGAARYPLSHDAYLARKYFPELDGLRAISVLLVVTVHLHDHRVWEWLGGWQGVSIFFVLSGYLITTLALREESQRGSLSLSAFYIRRSFRIFPLYYLVLAFYCLLIYGVGIGPEKKVMLSGAMPYYLLYLQEVPHFFGLPNAAGVIQKHDIPFYQSWSLGIEEKFYLVWPLLAFVLWRGRRLSRLAGTVLLVLAFGALRVLVAPLQGVGGIDWPQVGTCLEPYFRILIGCLVAVLLHDRAWFERLRFLGRAEALWVTLALMVWFHLTRMQIPNSSPAVAYAWDVLYILAVTAFLVAVLLGEGPVQRVLRVEPLPLIGRLSYGIYLIHILCLNVAQRVFPPASGQVWVSINAYILTCLISIAAAWLLHVVVEKPLIEIGRRWSKRAMEAAGRRKAADAPLAARV